MELKSSLYKSYRYSSLESLVTYYGYFAEYSAENISELVCGIALVKNNSWILFTKHIEIFSMYTYVLSYTSVREDFWEEPNGDLRRL